MKDNYKYKDIYELIMDMIVSDKQIGRDDLTLDLTDQYYKRIGEVSDGFMNKYDTVLRKISTSFNPQNRYKIVRQLKKLEQLKKQNPEADTNDLSKKVKFTGVSSDSDDDKGF